MDTEDDIPDFLSGDHIVTPDLPPEPPPAAPDAPSQEPAAPAAPATDPVAAPAAPPQDGDPASAPAAAEPSAPAVRDVPLATFLDMRDKLQRAERALADRQAREAAAPPNREEDPEGYEQHQQATMQLVLFEQRRDMSRTVAEVKYGEQTVNAAFDWAAEACDRSPAFNRAVMAAPNPAAFVVGEYQRQQRDQALADVSTDDIAAFRAWKASQAPGAQPPAAAPPQPAAAAPAAAPPTFRRSLASAPSAGAAAAPEGQDGDQVFEGMFGTG